jgi:hypothetical protein
MPFWTWRITINFTLLFWTPSAFGEADFHKMKGRKTLCGSHNDLNTSDNKAGLTENFSASTEVGIQNF